MANSQVQDALDKVIIARKAANGARSLPGLTPDQQQLLSTVYSKLSDAEDQLHAADLKVSVQALQSGAKSLSDLCNQLNRSIDALAKVASVIDQAAKAIGALASVISTAAGAKIV